MKNIFTMFVLMSLTVACGDDVNDEVVDNLDAVEAVDVLEEVEENVAVEGDSAVEEEVDNSDDAVEEEEVEDSEEPPAENEEDEPQMDGDPTRFESSRFNPHDPIP